MATYYGVNRTLANTPTGSNITDPGVLEGKLRVMLDEYEASAVAIGSIIEIGKELPKGARVVDLVMITDALGAATIDIGDYEDADRYNADADVSAGAAHNIDTIGGLNYEVDETYTGKTVGSGTDRQITLTTAGAEINGTIKIAVLYTVE